MEVSNRQVDLSLVIREPRALPQVHTCHSSCNKIEAPTNTRDTYHIRCLKLRLLKARPGQVHVYHIRQIRCQPCGAAAHDIEHIDSRRGSETENNPRAGMNQLPPGFRQRTLQPYCSCGFSIIACIYNQKQYVCFVARS